MEAVLDGSAPGRPTNLILLVDDDDAVRQVMRRALCQAGLSVIEAAGGGDAVGLIVGPKAFDMLVTDVRMPGQWDGVAVASAWRKRVPGRPILFVSGFDDDHVNAATLALNEGVLLKPFARAVLVDAVCALLWKAPQAAVAS